MTLDLHTCYRALRARDARFDGRFFVAVAIPCLGLGWIAYFLAQSLALALQLQAQTALCQMKIEENARTPQR